MTEKHISTLSDMVNPDKLISMQKQVRPHGSLSHVRYLVRLLYRTRHDAGPGSDCHLASKVSWSTERKEVWNVTFEPPATIRIALPRWASVEVRVGETALAERSETIAVTLVVRQPRLGEIFGYTGWFQVRREMKEGKGA